MSSTPQISELEKKPLSPDMDEWEEFLEGRYREGKSEKEFRQYDAEVDPGVAEFYRLNHTYQTHAYALDKEHQYFGLTRGEKSIWEAAEFLNTLVDDSDPDTDLTQLEHLLQTSEAIRADATPTRQERYSRASPAGTAPRASPITSPSRHGLDAA